MPGQNIAFFLLSFILCVSSGWSCTLQPIHPIVASSTPAAIFRHYLLILASTSYIHTQIDREISTYNIVYGG